MTDADASGREFEHLDEDACTDIVAGFVSQTVLERAMKHIRTCPACEARLMAAGGDLESTRARSAPAGWGSPVEPSSADHAGPVRFLTFRRAVWLAVPLALAAGLLIVFRTDLLRTDVGSREEAYWMPATAELRHLRGSHSWDADSAFWNGIEAYEAHDADRARVLLQDATAAGGLEDLRRLYLASALVNAARGAEALKLLNDLAIEDLPAPWSEDAYWMKYQALVQIHESGKAREILDEMTAWPGRVGDLARKVRSTKRPG